MTTDAEQIKLIAVRSGDVLPFESITISEAFLTPCQSFGSGGPENRNTRRASIGERLMQPWLRGLPNSSCHGAAWSA
jgi:hypothetical protein